MVVLLYCNPWKRTLGDTVVRDVLNATAEEVRRQLDELRSCAFVILDPTRPLVQGPPTDYVMAAVLIGADAERHLPLALGAAITHRTHNMPVDLLANRATFCLGDGAPVGGASAEFSIYDEAREYARGLAIAGGAGLHPEDLKALTAAFLDAAMMGLQDAVREWCRQRPSYAWLTSHDQAPSQFAAILDLPQI